MFPLTVTSISFGSIPGISARTTILSPSIYDSIAGSFSSALRRCIERGVPPRNLSISSSNSRRTFSNAGAVCLSCSAFAMGIYLLSKVSKDVKSCCGRWLMRVMHRTAKSQELEAESDQQDSEDDGPDCDQPQQSDCCRKRIQHQDHRKDDRADSAQQQPELTLDHFAQFDRRDNFERTRREAPGRNVDEQAQGGDRGQAEGQHADEYSENSLQHREPVIFHMTPVRERSADNECPIDERI